MIGMKIVSSSRAMIIGAALIVAAGALPGLRASAQEGIEIPASCSRRTRTEMLKARLQSLPEAASGVCRAFQTSTASKTQFQAMPAATRRPLNTGSSGAARLVMRGGSDHLRPGQDQLYGRLLQIYFSVAHDPTKLNYQGPDRGIAVPSAIFPSIRSRRKVAKAYIGQLNAVKAFDAAIVTKIEPDRAFYPAEDYHQGLSHVESDCSVYYLNDLPKIQNLKLYSEQLPR